MASHDDARSVQKSINKGENDHSTLLYQRFQQMISHDLMQALQAFHITLKTQHHFSSHTLRAYFSDLHSAMQFWTHHFGRILTLQCLTQFTHQDFRALFSFRHVHEVGHRSNRRMLSSLRTFYRFIEKHHHMENNAVFQVHTPKISKAPPAYLSEKQISTTLSTVAQAFSEPDAKNQQWIELRNYAVLMILYATGMRISEVLQLNQEDVPQNNSDIPTDAAVWIRVLGKGNKTRHIPLMTVGLEAINAYRNACPFIGHLTHHTSGKIPLFFSVRGKRLYPQAICTVLRGLRFQLNLPENTTPHALRHAFASHLLAHGMHLRDIQELLGHSCISSTQIYTTLQAQTILKPFEAIDV